MRAKSMPTEELVKRQKRIGTGIAGLDGFLEDVFLSNTVTAEVVTGQSVRLEVSRGVSCFHNVRV